MYASQQTQNNYKHIRFWGFNNIITNISGSTIALTFSESKIALIFSELPLHSMTLTWILMKKKYKGSHHGAQFKKVSLLC